MKKVGRIVRESMVDSVKESVEQRNNVFVISYSSLSGLQMSNFRKSLKRIGARLYVSRNTVAKRALDGLKLETLSQKVNSQTAFIWNDEDSVEISKALMKFSKDNEGFIIQGGILEGKIIDPNDIQRLSDLPSREVLLSTLFATIQSPLTRLASVLNGKTRELIMLLKQLSEQKGGK